MPETDLLTSDNEHAFAPGLYLVATPIGNLGDITLRALDLLRRADLVLCEDTRVTGKLLSHYDIKARLQVYNDLKEHGDHGAIVQRIRDGGVVALVSDAGMPMLSDPGFQLVQAVQGAGAMVTSVPGPSAILSALQLSGLPSDAFLFLGFLPNKTGERKKRLQALQAVPATLILFERAQRVADLLHDARAVLGTRRVAVVREITKLFEEVRRGDIAEILAGIAAEPLRGEVVVLIDRSGEDAGANDAAIGVALQRALKTLSRRDAVDMVAASLSVQRRRVYDIALKLSDKPDGE